MTNEVSVSLLSKLAGAYQSGTKTSSGAGAGERGGGTGGGTAGTSQAGRTGAQPPPLPGTGIKPTDPQQGSSDEPARAPVLGQEQLGQAVDELNDLVQSVRRELRFSIDEDSGRSMIQVIDASTDEVIRQIPPEQVLEVIEHLKEFEGGLVQEKA